MMPCRDVARIASRVRKEVPGAVICGVLFEQRAPKPLSERIKLWKRNLGDRSYLRYVVWRIARKIREKFFRLGMLLLRLSHACPVSPNGSERFGFDELANSLREHRGSLFICSDMHSSEALRFVRELQPDLGIVYGTRILKPELFEIPRLGSINIHKRKVPDYRGGGPVGLWELLDNQPEIGVTVHRVAVKLDAGAVIRSANIPIEPHDTLESLALKADVVGNDLIAESVADLASGTAEEKAQAAGGRMFKQPKVQQLLEFERQLARQRRPYCGKRGRSLPKLLMRTIVFGPGAILRNWYRRMRGRFPVIVLYHHLISDRPHLFGSSTESFFAQIEFLKQCYRIVGLPEAVEMLRSGRVTAPTVVLTFDDGYRDNFVNLRAVTERTGVPVTMFLSSGHISDGSPFLHDLNRNIGDFLPLTWQQISFLARSGFGIGSHTRSHFNCGSIDVEALRSEIVGSKADLEEHLGFPIDFFSFPWGQPANISQPALELARATYQHVFSAYGGANFPSRNGSFWYLSRYPHSLDTFELELTLQQILELRTTAEAKAHSAVSRASAVEAGAGR